MLNHNDVIYDALVCGEFVTLLCCCSLTTDAVTYDLRTYFFIHISFETAHEKTANAADTKILGKHNWNSVQIEYACQSKFCGKFVSGSHWFVGSLPRVFVPGVRLLLSDSALSCLLPARRLSAATQEYANRIELTETLHRSPITAADCEKWKFEVKKIKLHNA